MNIAAAAAVTILLTQLLLRSMIKMLYAANRQICSTANYRGKVIPAIGGIVFIPVLMAVVMLLILLGKGNTRSYIDFLALALAMGLAGVVDDLIGDKRVKGLKKHIKSTLSGKMTTGFLKASAGFLMACIVSLGISSSYIEFIVNVLIISLFANTLNLFDLRPGRAVKVFLAVSLLLIASAGSLAETLPLIMLSLSALLYINYDLKEICMLGDTGANILGISLGYYSAQLMSLNAKLPVLAALVILNIIAEKLSITELISRSSFFSYLDNWGRGHIDGK